MRQRLVGNSGLRVSRMGLGTRGWGADVAEEEARRILAEFLGAGGSVVETSPAYEQGRSEAMLGALVRELPTSVQDTVIISTAAGVNPHQPLGRRVDCSRRTLLADLDRTLRALGREYIDIWNVGFWDAKTPATEVVDTVEYAVRSGKVRYAGVRGYSGWQLGLTAGISAARGSGGSALIVAQAEYNLLVRRPEEELLPAVRHMEMGFFAAAPLAQGVLTGKYRLGIPHGARAEDAHRGAEVQLYFEERNDAIVDALATAASGLGYPPSVLATAWVRDRPGVTSAIVGPKTVEQMREYIASEDIRVPQAISEAFDDITL